MDSVNEQNASLADAHVSLNTDITKPDLLDISTRCERCQEDLDGPCYEHTDVKWIIYDTPPIPLAHSSLPDALELINTNPVKKKEKIFAKQKITASTLFGPLIAPLIPLDELKNGPPRYTLWSEETQELQVFDLSDDFLCNWIKFVRPSAKLEEANVIAYQQRGSVYLVAVRDILPSTEMRVYLKMPRCSAIPSYQLSLLVRSLLTSYNRQKSEKIQKVNEESETPEAPTPKRKRLKRTSFQRTKKAKATAEEPLVSAETVHDMEGLSEVTPRDENLREEALVEIVKPTMTEHEKRHCENDERAIEEEAKVEARTKVQRQKANLRHAKKLQPDVNEGEPAVVDSTQLMRTKRVSREWSLMNKRFKSGEMTEEEKRNFENDETTIEQRKKKEVKRQKANLRHANKVAQMTKEEREAYLAKKRLENAKNAHKNNKFEKMRREKLVRGIPLTPEEKLKWASYKAQARKHWLQKRREKRLAEGKDPDVPPLPRGHARALPGSKFRQKLRQGLLLTPEEKLRHEEHLARQRDHNRKSYRKVKLAHGLKPKEVISRRKPPFRGQLTDFEASDDGGTQGKSSGRRKNTTEGSTGDSE